MSPQQHDIIDVMRGRDWVSQEELRELVCPRAMSNVIHNQISRIRSELGSQVEIESESRHHGRGYRLVRYDGPRRLSHLPTAIILAELHDRGVGLVAA